MALYRISDRHPNYPDLYFSGYDVVGANVVGAEDTRVGMVSDIFIDEESRIQFLVVALDSQAADRPGGKMQVLLPANRCANNFEQGLVYVRSLSQADFQTLQPYNDASTSKTPIQSTNAKDTASKGTAMASLTPETNLTSSSPTPDRTPHPAPPIQLYEERLVTQKQRIKTGEVKISKQTITETTDADIPITREKVIIEIESIYSGQTRVDFGDAEVAEDGTVRMGIYEEQAEVCRRIVPYQNVSVRKEVVQDMVRTQQVVRREELDVQTDGNPGVVQTDASADLV